MSEILDAIVVGAGFSGVYMLNSLRSKGFKVKLFESGGDFGGVWFWNSYPGSRVDTDFYAYQFSDPKLYMDFDFTERFPTRDEILQYFHHVDKVLDLSKDVHFNTTVKSAEFDADANIWEVYSTNGIARCRYLVLCVGYASKAFTPSLSGIDNFKGEIYHSSRWPKDHKVELAQKRVAVIGTGASGVQIIEEIGPIVKHLSVYQRTPNLALPMRQCSLPDPGQPTKDEFEERFAYLRTTFTGLPVNFADVNSLDVSPEERREFFEKLWLDGGFGFFVGTYADVLAKKEANDIAYAFWAEKTRPRINDERKRNILAPVCSLHPINTKRPSLERSYYEVFNQINVDIIDINKSPIVEITQNGIRTEKEGVAEIDTIICATGFDFLTGGIMNIDIRNRSTGETLRRKWSEGIYTFLGIGTAGFPNLLFLFGPQSPTAFSTGPLNAETQGEWLTRLLVKMRNAGKTSVEVGRASEKKWRDLVHQTWNAFLFPQAKSWYQGCNVPGKLVEPLCYAGGNGSYKKALLDCETNDYEGFMLN